MTDSEIDLFLEELKATRRALGVQRVAHPGARARAGEPRAHRGGARRARRRRSPRRARAAISRGSRRAIPTRPDALQGGDLGWRQHERLPELFAAALAKMKPGEVSEPLRSPAGFHLVKLNERRDGGASAAPVTQTRARHILVRTSEVVSENEARRRLADLRERIVNGGPISPSWRKRALRRYGSAARGGELDWIYPGDTVPEFERALQELKLGEVSQPVRTPFGYHLIQVLERRASDVSPERRRLQARQVLRERKRDEAYQEWLRQLRDQAYVELRLEER